jgi:Zn-dependent M28 family amino/carboxypeptidase
LKIPTLKRLIELAGEDNSLRRALLKEEIITTRSSFDVHPFTFNGYSGENIIVHPDKSPYVVLSAHYDVHGESLGANDNTSSLVVLEAVNRYLNKNPLQNMGVQIVYFDLEEFQGNEDEENLSGVLGSQAYVRDILEYHNTIGILNLDMVGVGLNYCMWGALPEMTDESLLVWSLQKTMNELGQNGYMVEYIENCCSDHESFYVARKHFGIDAITLMATDKKDSYLLKLQSKLVESGDLSLKFPNITSKIVQNTSAVKFAHNGFDTVDRISEMSLLRTYQLVIGTLQTMDNSIELG